MEDDEDGADEDEDGVVVVVVVVDGVVDAGVCGVVVAVVFNGGVSGRPLHYKHNKLLAAITTTFVFSHVCDVYDM